MPDPVKMDAVIDAVTGWHRWLVNSNDGSARASRARLKRCETVLETLMEPAAHRLLLVLHKQGLSAALDDRVLVLAAVLARVDGGQNTLHSMARVLGSNQQQVMSPLRFNALMQAMRRGDSQTRLRALRRAVIVAQKEGRFSVARLAGDILFWSDETARRWAYDYWQARLADDANEPDESAAIEPAATE